MKIERSAVAIGVTLMLLSVVPGMLIAFSELARAQDVATPAHGVPEAGEIPLLRDATSPGRARPSVSPVDSVEIGSLLKEKNTAGGRSPQLARSPSSIAAVANGDFENGADGSWLEVSTNGWPLILESASLPVPPHGGSWAVWLGGAYTETAYIRQVVEVPSEGAWLGYWVWIGSEDVCGFDFGGVIVNDTTVVDVFTLCEDTRTYGWVKRLVGLSAYGGQTVSLQIRAETDEILNSNLFVDDVALESVGSNRLYLPAVARQTGGPPPDPYAGPCDPSNDYCEPHNSCLSAHGPLKPGRAYSAYPNDRNDYYYLELLAQATVNIAVTNYHEDGQLVLRDPDDLQDPLAFDYETPQGDGVMNVSKANVAAGKYCVQVFTAEEHYQSSARYTLTLSD